MLLRLVAIPIACIPGVLVILAGNTRPGVAVLMLGLLIGVLFAIGSVSPIRTAKLFTATIIAKNIPVASEKAYEWVDEESEAQTSNAVDDDWLLSWLLPLHLASGVRWKVICGLVFGVIVGVCLSTYDLNYAPPKNGWMLPMQGAKDSLFAQACILTLGFAIWGSSLGGLFTSAIYRRALLACVLFAGFWSTCIGYAASERSSTSLVAMVTFFTTGGIAVGMLCAWCLDSESSDQITIEDKTS